MQIQLTLNSHASIGHGSFEIAVYFSALNILNRGKHDEKNFL